MIVTYCPLCDSALALDRRVDDRVLDFGVSGVLYDSFLTMFDRQTGSRRNILGHAVEGELAGERLPPVDHVDTFWFARVAFTPETEIMR